MRRHKRMAALCLHLPQLMPEAEPDALELDLQDAIKQRDIAVGDAVVLDLVQC